MGQCSSTLPTNHSAVNGGIVSETTTPTGGTTSSNQYDMSERDVVLVDNQNQNKRGNYHYSSSKNHGTDFNVLSPTTNVNDPIKSRKILSGKSSSQYHSGMAQQETPATPQSRDPTAITPMDIDTRDDAASPVPTSQFNMQFMIPSQQKYPLPDHAIRTRCYKLNLNAEPIGFLSSSSTTPSKTMFLGPFTETIPNLTFSSDIYDDDDDDDDDNDGTSKENREIAAAIQTAQIFRGITVSSDGTILSQNARATRSSRSNNAGSSSNKVKLSEKSRQAAKIDKANDLIEQVDGADAKLVSLVVIGEYDDMKYLVRDGSRKLREADGLPDDSLFSVNRPRVSSRVVSSGRTPTSPSSNMNAMFMANNPTSRHGTTSSIVSSSSSSRRRRVSGSSNNNNGTINTPTESQMKSPSQQQLPKLKSNPRDTTSSAQRRTSMSAHNAGRDSTSGSTQANSGLRGIRLDSCHDFMDVHPRNNNRASNNTMSGFGSDNDDWTHAWNLWNCGGGNGGTISPLQPSSPSSNHKNSLGHHQQQQHPSANTNMQQHHNDSRNDAPSSNYGGYNTRRVG